LPNSLTLVVGFDQREAISYHTFCQSVLEKSSIPVRFIPLAENTLQFYRENHKNISNRFVFSRFLTPYLLDFQGMAVFADGDMVCQTDIAELAALFDPAKAVQVVQHNYQTKSAKKYLNNTNINYPRKNWSSLVIFNCAHASNRILTPSYIEEKDGAHLHRFGWLPDEEIGALPVEWNWLATEYDDNPAAKIVHYTLGTPCFKDYRDAAMSEAWWEANGRANEGLDL
jgi:lipopolysaccharide biosynthesis glycosyltransferase